MAILVTGIAVWAFVHLFPSVAPVLRGRLIDRLGANPYRGLFSVLIVISLVLIVVGAVVYVIVFLLHPLLSGVSAVPY